MFPRTLDALDLVSELQAASEKAEGTGTEEDVTREDNKGICGNAASARAGLRERARKLPRHQSVEEAVTKGGTGFYVCHRWLCAMGL